MKKLSFLMAALLVAMTGCQKEPQVTETPDVNAKHYVAVNIALPTDAGTRANDEFNDGKAEEYKVNDVTLVFFDSNEKYVGEKTVTPNPWTMDGNTQDNITASRSTGAIDVSDLDQIASVLVVINNGTTTQKVDFETNGIHTAINGITAISSINGESSDNFLMTNAPKYTNDIFSYLVPIQTYTSEADAKTNPANVQVERATAKVEVKLNEDGVTLKDQYNETDNPSKVTFKNWNLDITNKSYYPVRKCQQYEVSNSDWWTAKNTFVNPGIYSTEYSSGRVYFAEDPNYNINDVSGVFNRITATTKITGSMDAPQYCLENTFAISGMNQNQSTRVILKAEFIPGTIKTGTDETWPTTADDPDLTWYMVGDAKEAYTPAGLLSLLAAKGVTDLSKLEFDKGVCNTYEREYGLIYRYDDAMCYYPVIIRHFDLSELGYTNTDEAEFMESFATNGGKYIAQDLGRYGVVRNNWYRLTINSVSQPGEPDVPEPGTGTDDEVTKYLACTIDILAWCTRDQSVDL